LLIDGFGVLDAELVAENHVAEFDWMREERVFLQFFESGCSVVVIHRSLLQNSGDGMIVLICGERRNV
jgi:hypothetical protein